MPNFSSSHFKRTCYISKHVCVWNCSVLNRSRIQAQLSPCKENIYKGNKYGLPSEAKHTKHIKTPKFATVPQDVWKRHTLYCSSAQDMYRVEIIDIMRYHDSKLCQPYLTACPSKEPSTVPSWVLYSEHSPREHLFPLRMPISW